MAAGGGGGRRMLRRRRGGGGEPWRYLRAAGPLCALWERGGRAGGAASPRRAGSRGPAPPTPPRPRGLRAQGRGEPPRGKRGRPPARSSPRRRAVRRETAAALPPLGLASVSKGNEIKSRSRVPAGAAGQLGGSVPHRWGRRCRRGSSEPLSPSPPLPRRFLLMGRVPPVPNTPKGTRCFCHSLHADASAF